MAGIKPPAQQASMLSITPLPLGFISQLKVEVLSLFLNQACFALSWHPIYLPSKPSRVNNLLCWYTRVKRLGFKLMTSASRGHCSNHFAITNVIRFVSLSLQTQSATRFSVLSRLNWSLLQFLEVSETKSVQICKLLFKIVCFSCFLRPMTCSFDYFLLSTFKKNWYFSIFFKQHKKLKMSSA